MRLVSVMIVVAALVLAGLVLFVVPRLMNRGVQQAQIAVQQARLPASDVLVTAKVIPAGTILKPEDVRWQRWPDEALDKNYLIREKGADSQKDAIGRVVLHGIGIDQPIVAQNLLKPGEAGFLAAALTPGMRAVSIKIDVGTGVAGFILPGDHVDVLLTERYDLAPGSNAGGERPQVRQKDVTSVILRNVRVLAIDQVMQDVDSKPKVGVTATVEVDLAQAQKIALATQMGTLSLVLRSFTSPDRPEAEASASMVQDYQVSPFRAGLLQQNYTETPTPQAQPQPEPAAAAGSIRVYHGTSVGGGNP